MSAIVPAILTNSREDLEQKLSVLVGLTDTVQIDVVDGRFAVPPSWPYTERNSSVYDEENVLPHLGQLHFEMDLMVSDAEEVAGAWISAGADRIVFHAESSRYLPQAISNIARRFGHAKGFAPGLLSLGIGLNVQSDIALLEGFLDQVDYVQFMGIARIGVQGQPFDRRVLRKIFEFRKKHPNMPIQVDGGVSLQNAEELLSAGVDRLVVGSDLWKASNIASEFRKYEALMHEHGIYS